MSLVLLGCERNTPAPGPGSGASAEPYVYDKAKYHYGGDYLRDLSEEKAFVHTGMFVGWLVEHGMIKEDFEPDTKGFKERKATGAKLYESWDGCLISEMLSDEGNRFARDYFDFDRGKYLADYQELLAKGLPSPYHVADTWENYDTIKKRIDQRYVDWKKQQK